MNIKQLLTATILLLPSGAYGQSEFDEAKFLAEQGDAEAQLNLGIRYANGEGVPEDDAEAVKLYRLAAKQGLARAQNYLGIMHANGDGVPENYAEAVKWFRLAAVQGYAGAQYNLGLMYNYGLGVPENFAEAFKLYRLAAKQGDAEAQNNLGIMYANGDGVPQNRGQTTFKRLGLPELRLLKKTVVCPRLHRLHCGNAGSFTGIAVEARCYLKKKKGMT